MPAEVKKEIELEIAHVLFLDIVGYSKLSSSDGSSQPRRSSSPDALYRKVLAIDPRYAPVWAGLARNFISETNQGLLPIKEGYAQAHEAATKALAIDPDYAPAHARLGF